MATARVDDTSDDSAVECDLSSVSDEELIGDWNYDRGNRHDVTRLDVQPPETDSFARRRCRPEPKKPGKPRKSLVRCAEVATFDGSRKSPVINDVTNKTKVPRQNMTVSSNRATSGVSSTHRRPTEVNESTTSSGTSRKDRMLMRPWLVSMANGNMISHLSWYNEERTQIRIPWKHGSRSCWTPEDCQLFKEWAKHTGKFRESKGDEPKRWKANFRCALNSLPDVIEVKNIGQTRGNNPYKVYELLQQVNKKSSPRKSKRTRRSKSDGVGKQLPLAATTNCDVQTTGRKMSAPSRRQLRQSAQENVTLRNVTFPATQRPTSHVIPTVVEDMSDLSQDEGDIELSETTDFQYHRMSSLSPSESSGYGTDSTGVLDRLDCTNIFPECSFDDFGMPSELTSELTLSSETPELSMEDTLAYHQLQYSQYLLTNSEYYES